MQPSFDIRLRAMIKSLTENILPTIEPGNQTAREQARIIIGSLELLRQQIDYAHWYEVVELKAHASVVDALAEVGGNLVDPAAHERAAEARELAGRAEVSLAELRSSNLVLRGIIADATAAAGAGDDEAIERRVSDIVLEYSKRQLDRERAFVAVTGFDVFPESLLSIEAALARG